MAKTLIWSVALIVSALILASGGINAQRDVVPIDEPDPPTAPTPVPGESSAVPVSVENFPTTQTVDVRAFPHVVTVEGTVDVGNFPATQNVAGTVDVGNLPLDAEGHLLISPQPAPERIKFVGFTAETLWPGPGTLNRLCGDTFPLSRLCTPTELLESIPYADGFEAMVNVWILIPPATSGNAEPCLNAMGQLGSGCVVSSPYVLPAACCGY